MAYIVSLDPRHDYSQLPLTHRRPKMQAILEQANIIALVADGESDDDELLPAFKYTERESPAKVVQAWIPAEPGKKFCVHWRCNEEEAEAKRGMLLVCHIYIDGKLVEWGHLSAEEMIDSDHVGEMEIAGKFSRGEYGGPPCEYPLYFGESESYSPTEGPAAREHIGTIRAVVFWAQSDRSVQSNYPAPDNAFADGLRDHFDRPRPLRVGDTGARYDKSCVRIHTQGKPTRVVEQDMRLRPEGENGHAFVFHYAHPDWLRIKGVMRDLPGAEITPPSSDDDAQAQMLHPRRLTPSRRATPSRRTVQERMRPKRPRAHV